MWRPVISSTAGRRMLDPGAPEDDTRTQLVAASLSTAFHLLVRRRGAEAKLGTPGEVAALIDPAFTFLRGGLDALKRREPPILRGQTDPRRVDFSRPRAAGPYEVN